MKITRTLVTLACLAAGSLLTAHGQIFVESRWTTFDGQPSLIVPDMNLAGASTTENISVSSFYDKIASVSIFLSIETDFDGDLYVYVQHGSTHAVLLNRSGRTASNRLGYENNGYSITLNDHASNGDIHSYQTVLTPAPGAPLTGVWQPDARAVDPTTSLVTSPRTAYLSGFQGQNPNGDWTLYVVDASGGGVASVLEWGVTLTVVPEPRETTLAIALGLLAVGCIKRRLRRPTPI